MTGQRDALTTSAEIEAIGARFESRQPVYQPRSIKRLRRTRARVDQLDRQIIAALAEDYPQSVRHVFYRMTDPRLPEHVEKSEHGYKQVQHRVAELRRQGRLPYSWVTDASRRGYYTITYQDRAEFLRIVAGSYRADVWRDAEIYCEVWCESRSIAGVIQAECERFAVSLYPAGGFTSMSLAYQAAEFIKVEARGRPVVVFYVGDYDPAGVLIDKDIEKKLKGHLGDAVSLTLNRIGITAEQITALDLPTKPRKAGDRRAPEVKHTVEAEAMPAGLLRSLLRKEIERLLPSDAVLAAGLEERSVQDYIARLADIMGSAQ